LNRDSDERPAAETSIFFGCHFTMKQQHQSYKNNNQPSQKIKNKKRNDACYFVKKKSSFVCTVIPDFHPGREEEKIKRNVTAAATSSGK